MSIISKALVSKKQSSSDIIDWVSRKMLLAKKYAKHKCSCCSNCSDGVKPCKATLAKIDKFLTTKGIQAKQKSAISECVARKIPIFTREHSDWDQDHCIAAAYGFCGESKKKDMSAIDNSTGGALVGEGKMKEKEFGDDQGLSKLRAFLDKLPGQEKDGLSVYASNGEPRQVIIDLGDWWDGDMLDQIKTACAAWCGDTGNIEMHNEQGVPEGFTKVEISKESTGPAQEKCMKCEEEEMTKDMEGSEVDESMGKVDIVTKCQGPGGKPGPCEGSHHHAILGALAEGPAHANDIRQRIAMKHGRHEMVTNQGKFRQALGELHESGQIGRHQYDIGQANDVNERGEHATQSVYHLPHHEHLVEGVKRKPAQHKSYDIFAKLPSGLDVRVTSGAYPVIPQAIYTVKDWNGKIWNNQTFIDYYDAREVWTKLKAIKGHSYFSDCPRYPAGHEKAGRCMPKNEGAAESGDDKKKNESANVEDRENEIMPLTGQQAAALVAKRAADVASGDKHMAAHEMVLQYGKGIVEPLPTKGQFAEYLKTAAGENWESKGDGLIAAAQAKLDAQRNQA